MIEKLYDYIEREYGQRGMWISDIAKNLQISEQNANILTYALGYRRGKKKYNVTLNTFRQYIVVKNLVDNIDDNIFNNIA